MRHLVALDAVAREGSFRRAATRLGYVQSAISHQIAALEGLIGKRLIERSRGTRPLALTPAGEILLAHADALIARVRAAQADLAALDGEGAAALRVGATPDCSRASCRRSCASTARRSRCTRRRPRARCSPRSCAASSTSRSPRRRCRTGRSTRCRSARIRSSSCCRRARRSTTRRASRQLRRSSARLPLIAHAPTREHVEEQLRAHGVEPRFVLEAETGDGGAGTRRCGTRCGDRAAARRRRAARRDDGRRARAGRRRAAHDRRRLVPHAAAAF